MLTMYVIVSKICQKKRPKHLENFHNEAKIFRQSNFNIYARRFQLFNLTNTSLGNITTSYEIVKKFECDFINSLAFYVAHFG